MTKDKLLHISISMLNGQAIFLSLLSEHPWFLPGQWRVPTDLELQLRRAAPAPGQHDAQQGGRPEEGGRAPLQLRHGAADPAGHRVSGLQCGGGEEELPGWRGVRAGSVRAASVRAALENIRAGRLRGRRESLPGLPSPVWRGADWRVRKPPCWPDPPGPSGLVPRQSLRVALPGLQLPHIFPDDVGPPGPPPLADEVHQHGAPARGSAVDQ